MVRPAAVHCREAGPEFTPLNSVDSSAVHTTEIRMGVASPMASASAKDRKPPVEVIG
jgi:hypothetical protein